MKLLTPEILIDHGFLVNPLKGDDLTLVYELEDFELYKTDKGLFYYLVKDQRKFVNDLAGLRRSFQELTGKSLKSVSTQKVYSITNYYKPGTEKTPEIDFKTSGILSIKGGSYMTDPFVFYDDCIQWIKDFLYEHKGTISMNVHFTYVNTPSIKIILSIFQLLGAHKKTNTKIVWEYQFDDDEMLCLGNDLEKIGNMKFEYKGVSDQS